MKELGGNVQDIQHPFDYTEWQIANGEILFAVTTLSATPALDSTHTTNTTLQPRLVQACFGEPLDRPPVWLMRQAGRYMPAYQAIRSKTEFLTLCKTPDLAAEVSLQPWKAFGMDAVIMFSDILVPCEAMGMELVFAPHGGPTFPTPLRSADATARLSIPDPLEKTGFVMTLIQQLRKELAAHPETALIGFAGLPWTLATYMCEGGGSKNFTHITRWMLEDPKSLHQLLDKIAQTIALYLEAQIEAGAQVVQVFDTWAGIASQRDYQTFVLPYQQQVIESIKTRASRHGVPIILYTKDTAHVLNDLPRAGADVISVDHRMPLSEVRRQLGDEVILQGNLDPNVLFASPSIVKAQVDALLAETGGKRHIVNLGHGVLQHTPESNVALMVDTVKAFKAGG